MISPRYNPFMHSHAVTALFIAAGAARAAA